MQDMVKGNGNYTVLHICAKVLGRTCKYYMPKSVVMYESVLLGGRDKGNIPKSILRPINSSII